MRETDQNQELLDDIVEEFTHRLRGGERPAIGEYSNRHPELRSEIEELLTSVAMIEELKTQPESQADSIKKEMREICRLNRIGDYRIVRELGRGGMGIVFEAVHESLGRRVAIKVMPNRTFDDEKYLERFKREAHAAANLHHTNIVSVFGMGQAGDHRYYVMDFVDGLSLSEILAEINRMSSGATQHDNNAETLTDHIAPVDVATNGELNSTEKKHLPPIRTTFNTPKARFRWAAKLGMQIADGLAYAHGMGMLHRDIKPANLLVDRFETVWLTDFGLVKNISNQSITKSGDIIGTPQYMAPEAFEGQYDERSETYCLGLTLYEMVTLQPAYENASTPELIRRITTTSPIPPRKIDSRIPRDLNRIIQKATSREPSYRYETAADMRNDLQAFLEDRPINARKISMTEQLYRWSRRNPLAASLATLSILMIVCVAITSTIFLSITNRQMQQVRSNENTLKIERRVLEHERNRANNNLALLGDWLDHMFVDLVLQDVPKDKDISLDGFDQLRGISTTVNETDAEFLSRMLKFYELFVGSTNEAAVSIRSATPNNDDEDDSETAIAQGNAARILPDVRARSHRRIGNIYHLSGEIEEAIDAYDDAIKIYEEMLISESNSLPLRIKLARVLNEKGQAIEVQGLNNSRQKAVQQYKQAEQYLQDRIDFADPALKMHGDDIYLELAKTLALIGAPHFSQRPQFPQNFRDGFDERLRQRPPRPGGQRRMRPEDGAFDSLARIMMWFKLRPLKTDESMTALDDALAIVNRLLNEESTQILHTSETVSDVKSDPTDNITDLGDVDILLLKATILTRKATLKLTDAEDIKAKLRKARNPEQRMASVRQDVELLHEESAHLRQEALKIVMALQRVNNQLAKSDEPNDDAKRLYERQKAEYQYAEALIRATPVGKPYREAIADLKKARNLLEKLTQQNDRNYEYRKLLVEVSFRLGRTHKNRKDLVNAERYFRQAHESCSKLIQEVPRNLTIQYYDFASLLQLAGLLINNGEHEEAEKEILESIAVVEALSGSKRRMPRHVSALHAGRYFALAHVYRESGNRQAAADSVRRAKELRGFEFGKKGRGHMSNREVQGPMPNRSRGGRLSKSPN